MNALAAMYRTMSYDILFNTATVFELNPDREKLAEFERFYNSVYGVVMNCIQGLYQIIVEGVKIEEVEQAEIKRYTEQ